MFTNFNFCIIFVVLDDGNYDEEEDSILFFNSSELSGDLTLCASNETDANYSDDDDDCNAMSLCHSKLDSLYVVANYNRQSLSKLKVRFLLKIF